MNRFELLAPAGDFSCLLAAFNAGADAVYLAGKSFGARAFAGNFETEELIEALDYAHLFNKKIYLTLNTLIKETEFSQIAEFLQPFYEHGLDGVIIQDLGLIPYLKKEFPLLELHGSTQMTVSNYRSAAWLREQGLCRVVPAREMSLEELKEIRKKADIEVEAFIHGAMCYSYSGQCLFSSFLGGRSGNRGRCAQPCRLPYKVMENGSCISGKKGVYPLSLKDLCSLPYIYELMDAGIDSFKIEGRMKSPEYVAGVTAVYRKYMDLYMNGERRPVAKEDLEHLAKLYIRSDMKDGYFKKHNGKDMISLSSPSYQGCDDKLVVKIHDKYCEGRLKQSINGVLNLAIGQPAELTVYNDSASVTVYGDIVLAAQNRPLSEEDAAKQIRKTGNSPFGFETLDICLNGEVFMPVKQLNELRRAALEELQETMLASCMCVKDAGNKSTIIGTTQENNIVTVIKNENVNDQNTRSKIEKNQVQTADKLTLRISIMTAEQFESLLDCDIVPERIYIPADLFYLKKLDGQECMRQAEEKGMELYVSLPRMIRKRDEAYLDWLKELLDIFDGILVKSLEGLAFLEQCDYKGNIVTDHSLYSWNRSALDFMNGYRSEYTYPLELSVHELKRLDDRNGEYVVYGRIPMMITANCIRKTMDCCNKSTNFFAQSLVDRYKKELPVYTNCVHCYNEIYNAVPMSLHKEISQLKKQGFKVLRLEFTDENAGLTERILDYYGHKMTDKAYAGEFPIKEYTQGHFKEGAV